MIGHFTMMKDIGLYQFKDLARLAPMGTSCPDHFFANQDKSAGIGS